MVVSTPTGPARARGTALRAHGPTATLRAGPRALRAQTFTGLRPHGPATGPDLYGPTASRARNGPKLLRAHGLTAHSGPEPLRPTASRPSRPTASDPGPLRPTASRPRPRGSRLHLPANGPRCQPTRHTTTLGHLLFFTLAQPSGRPMHDGPQYLAWLKASCNFQAQGVLRALHVLTK